jgi:hypothetical protein
MKREDAINSVKEPYVLEDEKVINLCIKRLGLERKEFDNYMKLPPKDFWEYPNSYKIMRTFKLPIWALSRLGIFTKVVYAKYFSLPYK